MRIVVLGATGMVGSRVVAEAAARRHQVTAVSRTATPRAGEVRSVAADAGDRAAMTRIFAAADAVVSATRPAPDEALDRTQVTAVLLDAAARAGRRLFVVGGAGPLLVPGTDRLALDDPAFVPPAWRQIAAASLDQLRTCERHTGDWTYVSPPALIEPGERTGGYRRGTTTLLLDATGRSAISAEDFAVALVDEVERPSGQPRITFAY